MKDTLIDTLKNELKINPKKEEDRIVEFIQKTIKGSHKQGAVIGLSGGLDSSVCAFLLVRALGKKNVLAILLPERDSSSINHNHAHLVAKSLGLEIIENDMSDVLKKIGIYDFGRKPLKNKEEEDRYIRGIQKSVKRFYGGYFYHDLLSAYYGEETSGRWKLYERMMRKTIRNDFAFQFTKVRMRMVYLYFYADQRNYAVIGTTDKSEYSTGIYCKYGDGANDIQILRHLYKTQIKQLAQYLRVPPEIISKPNSGDLYGNLPHTASLGMSYEELDTLLLAIEKGYPYIKLTSIVPEKGIESIKQLKKVADFVKELPLSLD